MEIAVIIVVDDGSSDVLWQVSRADVLIRLTDLFERLAVLSLRVSDESQDREQIPRIVLQWCSSQGQLTLSMYVGQRQSLLPFFVANGMRFV